MSAANYDLVISSTSIFFNILSAFTKFYFIDIFKYIAVILIVFTSSIYLHVPIIALAMYFNLY